MLVAMVAPTAGSGPKAKGFRSPSCPLNVAHDAPLPDQKPSRSPPCTGTLAANVFSVLGLSVRKGDSARTVYDPATVVGRKIIRLIAPPKLPANVVHDVRSHEPGGTTKFVPDATAV